MELSKFQTVAKKRQGWQAIDLGCVLARAWFFKLWLTWIVPAGACLILFNIVFSVKPELASLIVWWLKPIWERPLLFVVSRQIFGEQVSYRDIARHYISCNKKDWVWWLTARRLLPSRSFVMPVTLLEGLGGKARGARVKLLHRRLSSQATWLLISAVHIEVFIVLAIMAGAAMLIPSGVEIELQSLFFEHSVLVGHLYNFVWLFAASIIAPFYVCAGFVLYLQRRIDLEGWDIEIQFRQLFDRLRQRKSHNFSSVGVVFVLTLALFVGVDSKHVQAQDIHSERLDDIEQANGDTFSKRSHIKQQAHQILSAEPFLHEKTKKQLTLKKKREKESLIPEWLINIVAWLESKGGFFSAIGLFLKFIAAFIEVILWVSVLLLLALVFWKRRKWIALRLSYFNIGEDNDQPVAPKTLFGIALEDEPLPDDVLTKVRAKWREGMAREAFSLLLRAIILQCVDKGCRFKDGYTENECAKIVLRDLGKQLGSDFSELITHWQHLAYGHRFCSDAEFDLLCAIYTRWQLHE